MPEAKGRDSQSDCWTAALASPLAASGDLGPRLARLFEPAHEGLVFEAFGLKVFGA